MSERGFVHERALWIALVAVLATSLLWLATLAVLATVQVHAAALAPAFALARALVRVLVAVTPLAWPFLPLIVLGGMILLFALRPSASTTRRTVRHA